MATNVGDLLRATVCGTIFTHEFCNVWFFLVNAITGSELSLSVTAAQIEDQVVDPLIVQQSTEVTWTRILVENISNGIDFHDATINRAGTLSASEALPSFVAFSTKFARGNALTRNGYKRIPGLVETQVEGQTLAAATQSALQTIANDWLTFNVPGATGGVLKTVIMGRQADGSPDLARFQLPASVTVQAGVTSQVSRK